MLGLALVLWAGSGSKKEPYPGPGPEPGPGPIIPPIPIKPEPTAPIPTIEQVATVICVLFKSTHAAATPIAIVSDAYKALGTSVQIVIAKSPDLHQAAINLATQLYSGEASCDTPEDDIYAPSTKLCSLTGQPYNAARWYAPEPVYAELVNLGFKTEPSQTAAKKKEEVKRFQSIARSLKLGGYANAPVSYVDGIIGACMLIALEDARTRRLEGNWPFNVVVSSGNWPSLTKSPVPGNIPGLDKA